MKKEQPHLDYIELLDRQLSADELAHVETCAQCKRDIQELERTRELFTELINQDEVSEQLHHAIIAQAASSSRREAGSLPIWKPLIALAAGMLLTVGVWISTQELQPSQQVSPSEPELSAQGSEEERASNTRAEEAVLMAKADEAPKVQPSEERLLQVQGKLESKEIESDEIEEGYAPRGAGASGMGSLDSPSPTLAKKTKLEVGEKMDSMKTEKSDYGLVTSKGSAFSIAEDDYESQSFAGTGNSLPFEEPIESDLIEAEQQGLNRAAVEDAASVYERGEYQAAFEAFDTLLQKYPDDPESLYYRGSASFALGKNLAAIDDLRRVVEVAPEFPRKAEVFFKLGEALFAIGSLSQSRDYFERAAQADPLLQGQVSKRLAELDKQTSSGVVDVDNAAARKKLPNKKEDKVQDSFEEQQDSSNGSIAY